MQYEGQSPRCVHAAPASLLAPQDDGQTVPHISLIPALRATKSRNGSSRSLEFSCVSTRDLLLRILWSTFHISWGIGGRRCGLHARQDVLCEQDRR